MRICIVKATKRIIEMQSGGEVDRLPREHESFKSDEEYAKYLLDCDALEVMRLNTLKQNAINAGYFENDIEVKWVTESEYEAAKLTDPVEQVLKKEREEQSAIDALVNQKTRDIAIAELKKEGKLDADGNIPK